MRAELAQAVLYVDGGSETWEMDLLNRVVSHTFTDLAAACRVHGWHPVQDANPARILKCVRDAYGTVTSFATELGFKVQDVSPANTAKPVSASVQSNIITFPVRA